MFAWLFWNGLRDSMQVRLVLRIFFGDKKIQQLFINCILLNLVIFVGSSVMYMFLVTPLFNYMATTDRDDFRAAAEWVKFFLDILWMVRIGNTRLLTKLGKKISFFSKRVAAACVFLTVVLGSSMRFI
jgi:hypothetical protein